MGFDFFDLLIDIKVIFLERLIQKRSKLFEINQKKIEFNQKDIENDLKSTMPFWL